MFIGVVECVNVLDVGLILLIILLFIVYVLLVNDGIIFYVLGSILILK